MAWNINFKRSCATHLFESGHDIRTIQELLGYKNVESTMIDTQVINQGGKGVRSPADFYNNSKQLTSNIY